ncbi:O-methyltransferase [Sanyastnella coralliicola]|uniref:O-methyltransferase n=1 Tax=Sanyastnella coralliicola TaxID=3069118 RepID=UPI0027B9AF21|nr:class I SAM-dependent methyltransferase [Longitalea sp. SCSIO 12813]
MSRIWAYIRYVLGAKGIHGAHSPFIYDLFNHVFNDDRHYYAFERIERRRNLLLKKEDEIEVEDLGAGSRKMKSSTRKVSDIARTSLKRPKYARMLFRLCTHLERKEILEFGTSLGITTAYLASTGAQVETVEGAQSIHAEATEVMKGLKLEAKLINSSFNEYLNELGAGRKFDLIFIDGHHEGKALLHYATELLPHLSSDGVMVIDDINWSSDMQEAWGQLINWDDFDLSLDLFELGLLFRREGMVKQHHVIRY